MGREGLEPPYCKANTTICVQTGFTVQRRYLPGFAVVRGLEPLFEPATPPVLTIRRYHRKVVVPQSLACCVALFRLQGSNLFKSIIPPMLQRPGHFVILWTPGGFEPHPPRCQRGVLPGYTTRPIEYRISQDTIICLCAIGGIEPSISDHYSYTLSRAVYFHLSQTHLYGAATVTNIL